MWRRAVYGSSVSKHLLAFEQTVGSGAALPADAEEDSPSFKAQVGAEQGASFTCEARLRYCDAVYSCSML